MVQVHSHLLISDVDDASPEVVAVLVLQGYCSPLEDMLVVEMVVDGEDFLVPVIGVHGLRPVVPPGPGGHRAA